MKLKRFGLLLSAALVVALALSTTQASASRLTSPEMSGEATTYLKANPVGAHKFTTNGAGSFNCATPSSFSTSMSKTQAVTQFATGTLSDYGCALFGSSTTMKMNGCSFTFHPGAETAPGVFNGTFDVGPAGCGPITMKYLGSSCELKIYPKNGLAAEFINRGSGKTATVEVKAAASTLKYSENAGCGNTTTENGSYTGSWEMAGYSNAAHTVQVGVSVSNSAAVFLAGEPTTFNGESYPEVVRAPITAAQQLKTPNGTVSCKAGSYDGSLSSASAQLNLAPTYSECSAFGFTKAIVSANGCTMQLNVSGPTSGTAAIACPEGKTVTVEPYSFGVPVCTMSVPAQSLGAVTYSATGTGINRRVNALISATGVQYSGTGGFCGKEAINNATYNASLELRGEL